MKEKRKYRVRVHGFPNGRPIFTSKKIAMQAAKAAVKVFHTHLVWIERVETIWTAE